MLVFILFYKLYLKEKKRILQGLVNGYWDRFARDQLIKVPFFSEKLPLLSYLGFFFFLNQNK